MKHVVLGGVRLLLLRLDLLLCGAVLRHCLGVDVLLLGLALRGRLLRGVLWLGLLRRCNVARAVMRWRMPLRGCLAGFEGRGSRWDEHGDAALVTRSSRRPHLQVARLIPVLPLHGLRLPLQEGVRGLHLRRTHPRRLLPLVVGLLLVSLLLVSRRWLLVVGRGWLLRRHDGPRRVSRGFAVAISVCRWLPCTGRVAVRVNLHALHRRCPHQRLLLLRLLLMLRLLRLLRLRGRFAAIPVVWKGGQVGHNVCR